MRLLVATALLFAVACSGESRPPLEIANIEITAPLPGRSMSAGFMQLRNNTDDAITITDVHSPDFVSVEIHQSTVEDGVARMRRVDLLEVPARSTVTLERGGLHLMLMRPRGTAETVRLGFHAGETVIMEIVAQVGGRSD